MLEHKAKKKGEDNIVSKFLCRSASIFKLNANASFTRIIWDGDDDANNNLRCCEINLILLYYYREILSWLCH